MAGVPSQFFPENFLSPGFTPGATSMSFRNGGISVQLVKVLNKNISTWQFLIEGRRPDIFVGPDVNPGILIHI